MKTRNRMQQAAQSMLLVSGMWLAAGAVHAQEARPAPAPAAVQVDIGWHGDRYWDGHRYWARDEWMRHHPKDRGPRQNEDRRQPPSRPGD